MIRNARISSTVLDLHFVYLYRLNDYYIIIFNLRTAAFKAYCAIWVRRSNFHYQVSPHVTMWEHPAAEGGTVGEVSGNFAQMPIYTLRLGIFKCHKATTWDQRLYFSSEGRRAEDFFALKIRQLQPGANLRTWVPKTSTLPLDHWSRFCLNYTSIEGDRRCQW
jgi:hypothetical protein